MLGRPLRLVLTPGNTSDVKGADLLIGETIGMKRMIDDRGYDANKLRATLKAQNTIPVIPVRSPPQAADPARRAPLQGPLARRGDGLPPQGVGFAAPRVRRVATRYDKLARNFLSAVHLAAAVAFWL